MKVLWFLIALGLFMLFARACWAEIPEETALRCIVGEAGNQGIDGMIAVGEVLRRRDSTRGLYGCKNGVYERSSNNLRARARKAWKESRGSNLTKGATHFENVEAFGTPYWAKSMQRTVKIKDHTFFRM